MKRWAIITVVAYAMLLVLLTVPLIVMASIDWSSQAQPPQIVYPPHRAAEVFGEFGYWITIGVFVITQVALLIVPVRAAERRPIRRRHVGWLIGTASFLMANLVLAGGFSALFGIFGDAGYAPIDFFARQAAKNPLLLKTASFLQIPAPNDVLLGICGVVAAMLTLWGVWLVVFYRFSMADESASLGARLLRWLLRGSILELLVAVPSHIAVRGRSDCCAGFGTFWGMATGLSVMLMTFGPGVFFLFAQRMRRLQPAVPPVLSGDTEKPFVPDTKT